MHKVSEILSKFSITILKNKAEYKSKSDNHDLQGSKLEKI